MSNMSGLDVRGFGNGLFILSSYGTVSSPIITCFSLVDQMTTSVRNKIITMSSGKLPSPSRSVFTCQSLAEERMHGLPLELCDLDNEPTLTNK